MRLVFSIFFILSVNAEDLSNFIDDYYGMNDYEMDYGLDPPINIADFLDRLTNMMTKRGLTFVIYHC